MADAPSTKGKSSDATQSPGTGSSGGPKAKKKRLGRGLGSLLSVPVDVDSGQPATAGDSSTASGGRLSGLPEPSGPGGVSLGSERLAAREADSAEPMDPPAQGQVSLLDVGEIQPNRHQPRSDFDENRLQELATSIERSGLMQPIVVRSTGNTGEGPWELIAGERRLRAVKHLGRSHVPAIVIEAGEREAAELALIENLQREDLNPIERAQALVRLRDSFGLTQKDLSERVGLDRSSIANLIRILELDDFSIGAIRRGALSTGHAKALLSISDQALRRATAAAALQGGWSVRELERRVRRLQPSAGNATAPQDGPITARRANVVDLERRLGDVLGMRVQITLGRKKGSGKIQIAFDSLDQFDQLTGRLGLDSSTPS